MTYEDPFNNAPEPDEAQTNTTSSTIQPPVVIGEGKVTLTYKGGTGYDAPWIVFHPSDLDEAIAIASEVEKLEKLFNLVQSGAKVFAGLAPAPSKPAAKSGGGYNKQSAPPGATEAPNGETRFCEHGQMEFRSGTSKAGNNYALFSCTQPRNNQCKAQYLNDK